MVDKWTVESNGTLGGSRVLRNGVVVENVVSVDFKLNLAGVVGDRDFLASLELIKRLPPVRHKVNLVTDEESAEAIE